jgi:diguanylate cyclase (GGDEF)-like protein
MDLARVLPRLAEYGTARAPIHDPGGFALHPPCQVYNVRWGLSESIVPSEPAPKTKRSLGLRGTLTLFTLCAIAAAVAIGGISWWGHERGTTTATETFVAKDVTADILPPPMYLIEMRLVLSEAAEGSMSMDKARLEYDRLRTEYDQRTSYWREHPPHGLEKKLLGAQHDAAVKFMVLAGSALETIEHAETPEARAAALQAANEAYRAHRSGVDDTLREANAFVSRSLEQYENTARLVRTIQVVVLITVLVLLVLLGWWIGKTVWAAVGGEPEDAAAVARAVVRGDLSVAVPVQPGDQHSIMASMHEMFVYTALHDGLTGSYNRTGFERAVTRLFDGQPHTLPASIIILDLDYFKPINDLAGHAAGDTMLIKVTQAVTALARASDVVARLGGDEFGVLLPTCSAQHAMVVAEKIRLAIENLSFPFNGSDLKLGASLGIAELNASHTTAAAWIADADHGCLTAKRDGRGVVRTSGAIGVIAPPLSNA